MNLVVIKKNNEKYGMLSVEGTWYKIDKKVIEESFDKKTGGKFRVVNFDDKDNVVLLDIKGNRSSIKTTILFSSIDEIQKEESPFLMLGPAPKDSYLCGKAGSIYLVSPDKKELVTKKTIAKLRTIGATNFVSAINRAYKAYVMLILDADRSPEYYIDLLSFIFPYKTGEVKEFRSRG